MQGTQPADILQCVSVLFLCFNSPGAQKAPTLESLHALDALFTAHPGDCGLTNQHISQPVFMLVENAHLLNKTKIQQTKKKKERKVHIKTLNVKNSWCFILLCPHLVDSTIRSSISCTVWKKHLLKALELVVWRTHMWVKMSHRE